MKNICLALLVLLCFANIAGANQKATAVHDRLATALEQESVTQKEFRRWTEKKEELAQEIRNMKLMDSWLDFQNMKYSRYVEKQKAVIAGLEKRKEEAKRIEMELGPFLEEALGRLQQLVADDLPFLTEERSRRLTFLRESLDDYHLTLSEKLRRVLEAYQVEAQYGSSVECIGKTLELNGRPTQVEVFRLGRLALFYRTLDNQGAGSWNRESGNWQELEPSFAGELKKAEEMALRKRAVEMLSLPIGGVL